MKIRKKKFLQILHRNITNKQKEEKHFPNVFYNKNAKTYFLKYVIAKKGPPDVTSVQLKQLPKIR